MRRRREAPLPALLLLLLPLLLIHVCCHFVCRAVSQTTATAAPSSALYEWPQSRDVLLATPPRPRQTQRRWQRKEIKCTSFMRELGSYFCLPLALSLPPSRSSPLSPLCLRPCAFSLSTQCANNGSALLTQKVALWPQFSPQPLALSLPPTLSLLQHPHAPWRGSILTALLLIRCNDD